MAGRPAESILRPASEIVAESGEERFLQRFDLLQIDAPNPHSFWRLKYLRHLDAVADAVSAAVPAGSTILDIGCAGGNLSLALAERGYRVMGVDLRAGFISYARKKDHRSLVSWSVADAFAMEASPTFAAVVLPEVIEHVTDPAGLIRRTLGLLRPGGRLVLTTPNGHCVRNRLPSFEQARQRTNGFAGITIGPAGEDHIFAFRLSELRRAVREADAEVVLSRFYRSILLNSHVQPLLDLPGMARIYEAGARLTERIPVAGRLLCDTILLVVRRRSDNGEGAPGVKPAR